MRSLFNYLFFLCCIVSCSEKEIYIDDINFKNALLNSNCIDTNGDGEVDSSLDLNNDKKIQAREIEKVEILNVSYKNIKSLKGIEAFINLKRLDCHDNKLKSLDVSRNSNLEVLYCYDNYLTTLDVSKNKSLKKLGCRGNKLIALDLSSNPKLDALYCYENNLTYLNVRNGNNSNLQSLLAHGNPALICIEVDDLGVDPPLCDDSGYGGWCKDETASYQSVKCD
ncbi:MAG: leucine-rich repeat domain-containing protein [Allomuricauda sp.]